MSAVTSTDVLIVGAGPVALFAVFELGLFDMKCHLIDALDRSGGQCAVLYPDKPIYDIPTLPAVNAQDVVDRLMRQIEPFKPQFSFNRMVTGLERLQDGTFRATTDEDEVFEAKVVVIAAGAGAFQPKRPPIPDIAAFEGKSVFYSVRRPEDFHDHDVLIAGGGESAIEWALNLAPIARSVTLVHRKAEFSAPSEAVDRMFALREAKRLDFQLGQVAALGGHDGNLTSATIKGPDGDIEVACTRMLPFFGLTTRLGPLADWGLNLSQDMVPVDTARFETSEPGIFAIGDICSYPGKLRLILSGFHEAALMAQAARRIVHPAEKPVFQYTTSSTSLQRKLSNSSKSV